MSGKTFSVYNCPYCDIVSISLYNYLTHLQLYHQNQHNFRIGCNVDGCSHQGTFKLVHSLRKHICKHHAHLYRVKTDIESDSNVCEDINENQDAVEHNSSNIPSLNSSHHNITLDELLEGLQKHFVMFLLNLQEKHRLPQTVQETVVSDVKFMFQYFTKNYADIIKFHLKQCKFDLGKHEDIQELLNDAALFDKAIDCISSDYKFVKYCRDKLNLVEPVEYNVGVDASESDFTGQYVPLLDLLKIIMETESVYEVISAGIHCIIIDTG